MRASEMLLLLLPSSLALQCVQLSMPLPGVQVTNCIKKGQPTKRQMEGEGMANLEAKIGRR